MMKAIMVTAFGGPENMIYTDTDLPEMNAKQVLIRVAATSVNFADIKARYGKKGGGKLPFIPGVDVAGVVERVLDSISGRVSEQSMACLAPYGRLVHFGNASGEVGGFQTVDLHASCRSVLGFSFGTTRQKRPHLLRPVAERVLPLIANGKLQIKIGKTFPLQEAALAHEWVESRRSTGKVLLEVN